MTERLSQLLHEEAGDVLPPAPDPGRILADGRRLRRRRRIASGIAAAAAVAVVGAGAVTTALVGIDHDPDTAAVPRDAVVYGFQSEVHLGDDTVRVPGTVERIDHTAEGVLVTTSTPDRLVLVRGDGSQVDLGAAPADTVPAPATSPLGDVYVLTGVREGSVVADVRDLTTGETVDRWTVDPPPGWRGRPPFTDLDDDTLYLDFRTGGTVALDLRSGASTGASARLEYVNSVNGGRTIVGNRREFSVADALTGEVLLTVPTDNLVNSRLSPDGRWYVVVREEPHPASPSGVDSSVRQRMSFYDVATGAEQTLTREIDRRDGWAWGWTRGGEPFWVEGDSLVRCDPATAQCTRAPLDVPAWGVPTLAEVF